MHLKILLKNSSRAFQWISLFISQVEIRLKNAALEMECWRDYRYTIISGSMEENIEKFRAVMRAERYLSHRMTAVESSEKATEAAAR